MEIILAVKPYAGSNTSFVFSSESSLDANKGKIKETLKWLLENKMISQQEATSYFVDVLDVNNQLEDFCYICTGDLTSSKSSSSKLFRALVREHTLVIIQADVSNEKLTIISPPAIGGDFSGSFVEFIETQN